MIEDRLKEMTEDQLYSLKRKVEYELDEKKINLRKKSIEENRKYLGKYYKYSHVCITDGDDDCEPVVYYYKIISSNGSG